MKKAKNNQNKTNKLENKTKNPLPMLQNVFGGEQKKN